MLNRKTIFNIIILVLNLIALILISINISAPLSFIFTDSEGLEVSEVIYYSYFDFELLRYGTILPFIIGLLLVSFLIIFMVYFFLKKDSVYRTSYLINFIITIISLVYIIYNAINKMYSVTSIIALILNIASSVLFLINVLYVKE